MIMYLEKILLFLKTSFLGASYPAIYTARIFAGGGSGIRTHENLATLLVFETSAFVRSAIPPRCYYCNNIG